MEIQFIRIFNFRNFDSTTASLLLNVDEILSEFHRCVRKCQNSLRIGEHLQKMWKVREISESGDNIFSFRMNNSIQSLVPARCPAAAAPPRAARAGQPARRAAHVRAAADGGSSVRTRMSNTE